MTSIWIILFIIITFFISALYFYMFSRGQERFMKFWALSWVAYSLSLLCVMLYYNTNALYFLEIRKVVDMFNLLLLLFGSYSFVHIKIPAYWYRFSLYLLLLAAICIFYKVELLSFYLPISIYQLAISVAMCFNIYTRWNIPRGTKLISAIIFIIWGIGKPLFSIIDIFSETTNIMLITEVSFSNILNFCILTIYITYTRKEQTLSSNLYKTVVDNANEAIIYYKLKPYHAFEYVSPSVKKLTGFEPSSFYQDPSFLKTLMADGYTDPLARISDDESLPDNNPQVMELVNKNGDKFWGEFVFTVIHDEYGESTAVEGTLRDITNIKTAELEQINITKSRDTLLSYISHELRTPVTSIAGYLTALNDGILTTSEEKNEAIEVITAKTMTLKKLVDDLDQLSKLETNQFTFDFMTYNTIDLIEELLTRNVPDARSAGFKVNIDYDSRYLSGFYVIIDIERINQVFSNLISNSIKYSADNKELSLTFNIDDTEENLVISVKDNGIGIAEQSVSHIFDKFYRAENSASLHNRPEGRGLGLPLSKEIIAAHQGDIYVESTFKKGSTFTFILPLYKEG